MFVFASDENLQGIFFAQNYHIDNASWLTKSD